MRAWVAEALGEEQLDMYRMLAVVGGDENTWAVSLEERGVLSSLESLQAFVALEGSMNDSDCLWADAFAIKVIAEKLNLAILLVDMARDIDCHPFRWLARPRQIHNARFVVLKRERQQHFVPLQYVVDQNMCWGFDDLPPLLIALWSIRGANEVELNEFE